jgi:hypothetical protein
MAMKARNAASIRRHTFLQWPFGTGGRRLPLVRTPPPGQTRIIDELQGGHVKGWLKRLRRSQFGQQDKCFGLAELADAIATDRPHFPSIDFTLHLTELTLAIQAAGPNGACTRLSTRFDPLSMPDSTRQLAPDYTTFAGPGPVPRLVSRLIGNSGARRA